MQDSMNAEFNSEFNAAGMQDSMQYYTARRFQRRILMH